MLAAAGAARWRHFPRVDFRLEPDQQFAAEIEHRVPAHLIGPALEFFLGDALGLVIMKAVSHAVAVEPGAGLLHGVAVFYAVDGDGQFRCPSLISYRSSRRARGQDRPGSRASPTSIGCAIASCSLSLSSSPSERLITTQATPLPIRLVSARHSDMNLSMPTRMAIDWIGMSGTIERVAASVMKPAPVTPEAPFEVIMAMPRMPSSCQIVRLVLVA